MVDYTKKYEGKYNNEHSRIYDAALAAPSKVNKDKDGKEYSYKHLMKKHDTALSPALEKLNVKDDKVYQSYVPALSTLTEAFIAYKKKAGVAVTESEEGKARESSELEQLIEQYMKQNKIQSSEEFVKHLNMEGPSSVMADILKMYKGMDLQKFAQSRVRAALPAGKGFDFYHGLAHYHGKTTNMKYSKRKLTQISNHDALSDILLNSFYRNMADEVVPDEESIKDTSGKPK
ncbi:MAG: hypothetical protein ACP5N1_02375 [Candidatus Woesearchaeota archaeon]